MEARVYQNHVPHAYTGYGCYLRICCPSAYSYDLLMKQQLS